MVVTAAYDLQVRVEEGAHLACGAVELVFAAVPSVEDALGDRRAEQKGNLKGEGNSEEKRVDQRRPRGYDLTWTNMLNPLNCATAVSENDSAQRDSEDEHDGRDRSYQ
eukprot:scaffold34484_cov63-Phaeocystis_antarctica.AAC.7